MVNIANPSAFANEEFNASQQVTKPLVDLILSEDQSYTYEVLAEQINVKSKKTPTRSGCCGRDARVPHTTYATWNGPSTRKGSFQLAHCHSTGRAWIHPAQIHFPRCLGPEVWLGSLTDSFSLCLWPSFLSAARSLMFERRFPSIRHNELRDHCLFVERNMPWSCY